MSEQKAVEIKESDIRKNQIDANKVLNSVKVNLKQNKDASNTGYRSTVVGANRDLGRDTTVSVYNTIAGIDKDSPMLSDSEHHVLSSLYRGISISAAMYEQFKKSSGLDLLIQKNRNRQLDSNDRPKFQSLLRTGAVVLNWVAANYVQRELAESAKSSGITINDLEQLNFENVASAQSTFLYEMESNIRQFAQSTDDLISVVYEVANKTLDQIELILESLEYTNYFTSFSYEVVKDNFEISGFSRSSMARSNELIMTFKKPEEVIGNAVAKYNAQKITKMLMCYDFERKMNPFADLGGFIFTFFGDGNPGTGKTTLIQMMAGLLNDYCKNANYPFHYENFSVDKIDSFQGKSAQHAKQFIKNVTNPNVIGFGTIDDIDQIAGKRGDKKASEGQLGVTATLMESFAGANTKVLGNSTFGMFSNHPEQVDDALRQRAGSRFLIDGPQTFEDFVDLSALFAGKEHNIPTGNIELFAEQQIKNAISKSYEKHNLPETDKLKEIYENTLSEYGHIETLEAIGRYLHNIKEVDPRFTGRAVANIFNSATSRTMDFDMPDEWFEDPETFLLLPYETKKNMINELRTPLDVKTLIQEINRYADSEFRYGDNADDIEIKELARSMELHQKASNLVQKNS